MSENNAVIIGPSAEKLLYYWTDLPLTYPTIINLFDTDVRESILTELIEAARKEGRKIYLGDSKSIVLHYPSHSLYSPNKEKYLENLIKPIELRDEEFESANNYEVLDSTSPTFNDITDNSDNNLNNSKGAKISTNSLSSGYYGGVISSNTNKVKDFGKVDSSLSEIQENENIMCRKRDIILVKSPFRNLEELLRNGMYNGFHIFCIYDGEYLRMTHSAELMLYTRKCNSYVYNNIHFSDLCDFIRRKFENDPLLMELDEALNPQLQYEDHLFDTRYSKLEEMSKKEISEWLASTKGIYSEALLKATI